MEIGSIWLLIDASGNAFLFARWCIWFIFFDKLSRG